ncbi:MAG TPA: adenylate/guanylate cyclase domain-containing protein [Chitinophagaceae bacterium]|nr:adenylate/guanylate cyclase domain-containing protein [Chitinophagaceae bacterium]
MSDIRKIVAIMFTDIVGYTKLMGIDEQKTLKLLDENKNIHQSIIGRHSGMCIKEMGDGMLASFDTASDAVTAAIEIQKECTCIK